MIVNKHVANIGVLFIVVGVWFLAGMAAYELYNIVSHRVVCADWENKPLDTVPGKCLRQYIEDVE